MIEYNGGQLKTTDLSTNSIHSIYAFLDSITEKDQREMTKEVLDIVKRNHKINIAELNKMILDVIRVDEGFRMKLVQ
jgi:hypothetical protein